MKPANLNFLLSVANAPLLIDARSKNHFNRAHIAGARHAHVHEMGFVDAVKEAGASPEKPVVVYGYAGDESAAFAKMKLVRADFADVEILEGSVDAWSAEGFPLASGEGTEAEAEAVNPLHGEYPLNLEKSVIEWRGRNIGSRHEGTLKLKEGSLTFGGDALGNVDLVVDMSSIHPTDIEDEKTRGILIAHLANEDFFETDRFPTARFSSRKIEAIPGSLDYTVTGDLTIRGVTRPMSFMANAGRNYEGKAVARAMLDFDRTEFGSIYGSGKFFKNLGFHLVMDWIDIEVILEA